MSDEQDIPNEQEDMLTNRLYVSPQNAGKPIPMPTIIPENNPLYPKRVSMMKNLGQGNKAGTIHFTQLANPPKVLQSKAKQSVKESHDERLIITTLVEPLEAVKLLDNAQEGTFFYMQRADKLSQQPGIKPSEQKQLDEKEEFELLVCPHTLIDLKDYFTLSKAGMTHISESQHSFTDMKEWLDELQKLQKLRQIGIFRNFRTWKPLRQLKRAVTINRQARASGALAKNLFTVNNYLRYSLAVTLECTNGIRSMNVIVIQQDVDEHHKVKNALKKMVKDNRKAIAAIQQDETEENKKIKQQILDCEKFLLKLFENFSLCKPVVKQTQYQDNETENQTNFGDEGQTNNFYQNQEKVFKYPFTIEQYDDMTKLRCQDLTQLFDAMMTQLLTQMRSMVDEVISSNFGQTGNTNDRAVKAATSYTERASRINMCKRLLGYLRLTDFMIMDSLYDFQYATLQKLYQRMFQASKFPLLEKHQVVATLEELIERERIGQYLFDGKEAAQVDDKKEEEGNVLDDGEEKIITIGDGSRSIFVGYIQCGIQNTKSEGSRELRQEEDPLTPGYNIQAGQTAVIQLSPSADDFYQAVDTFNESLLSILDCIKRLTNHEDFADISLPVFSNSDATFENVEDVNKLQLLQEINAPTLQVLFASNPNFRQLVNNLKNELYNQYNKAQQWSQILQPFFDAYNQTMNLNVSQIERKLFQTPVSMFEGDDLDSKDKKWSVNFKRLITNSVWDSKNDYETLMNELLSIDFKDVATMTENHLKIDIKSKADVPMCSKSGLNKFTLQENLISDAEFNDILSLIEHNRRLHTSMPQIVNLGMFSFDLMELKKAFLPTSQRALNFLRYAIPAAIVKRYILLLTNIYMLKKYINSTFYDIESFILYREVVLLISDEVIDSIKAIATNILDFSNMYQAHGIPLPPQILNLQIFFNQQFEIFKSQIINAESNLDSLTNNWLMKQNEECIKCQKDLEVLKTQMRLKSLNKTVELFNVAEMAQFVEEYNQDRDEFAKLQEEYQLQLDNLIAERTKQLQSGNDVSDLNEKISDIQQVMLPECMVCSIQSLTAEEIIKQHKYYILKEEQDEEQEEPDELEEEKIVEKEEEAEVEDEVPTQSENATETNPQEVNMDDTNKLPVNPEEEETQIQLTYHHRISKALIKLQFRAKKTDTQKQALDKVESKIKQVRGYQQSLSAEPHEFPLLEVVSQHIRQYYNLWTSSLNWLRNIIIMSRQNFLGEISQDQLGQLVAQTGKIAFMCERSLQNSEMPVILKQRVTEMRQVIPIVNSLDNSALREQHWKNVGDILSRPVPVVNIQVEVDGETKTTQKPQVNIAWLVQHQALMYKDSLSQVSNNAANELSLEKQYKKIDTEWQKIELNSSTYKDSHDIFVLKDTADLITKLEDALLVVSGIACSRYVAGLKEVVESLFDKLKQLNYSLDVFLKVQKGYLYLLNIFNSGDIQKQLPTETKMFQELDGFWRRLMLKVQDYPQALGVTQFQIIQVKDEQNLIGLSLKPSPLEIQLKKYEMMLELIQKSLDNYLHSKRLAFARLFFISDDELLDLLAQAKNPHMLQGHMRKLFENVVSVELVNNVQAGGLEIVSLISEEGEKLVLTQSVKPRGSITAWLQTLEQKMKQSVAKAVKQAIDGYQNYQTRNQWIINNLGQTIIAAGQVFWCSYLTEAIDGKSELSEFGYGRLKGEANIFTSKDAKVDKTKQIPPLQLYYNKFEADLQSMVQLIKSNLTKLQRGSITALATIETHSRDTIQQLINAKPTSTADFEFQKLQRYYYNPQDIEMPIHIKQNTTIIPYLNEYLGASARLVITPLTDLVYLHIAVSVQNCKAINLAGPAGTGKSETTKDQNKSRANSCVVFNCSENVEISVMNRFFMGFCITGAGSCLDEFNRLELSLLSVIAGSIKQILDGLKVVRSSSKKDFIFNGQSIYLHPDTLLAISLNPGYAGRAELPQNLKNLFRSFSMVVPDYSLISEIILFSQGFTTAKPLSRKVVQLYKLSSEQLSQQNSYDFGMRGVKSVLSMAGNLRRKFPDQSEEMVLIRAMQDSNLPRMIAEDRDLFMGIVQDLFPNVVYQKTANNDFVQCIERSMKNHNYQLNNVFIEKINQVFETCQIRHGVLLMGPAKSGKTVCIRTMAESIGFLRQKVEQEYSADQKKIFDSNFPLTVVNETDIHLINSKAITLNELYGSYDDVSGEWKDGLIGSIMRKALENSKTVELKTHKQFILFDSHVSTEWIESMNSLLDDSKLLCLANSERLKINDYINIMFECESLKHASPATVSRLGIIYYPDCTLAETLKIQTIQMRPAGGFKNMTEDEITAHDQKVLQASIVSSLNQSIVRWDHIVISWFQQGFEKVITFGALHNQIVEQKLNTESIEASVFQRIHGLILKLFAIFVPQGFKFLVTNAQPLLPTNEIQLVRQTLDIFSALLKYNRSLAVLQKNCKQEQLNKFAQENGLNEAQQAQDLTQVDPLDISLIIRFLCVQFLQRNPAVIQSPPGSQKLNEMLKDHVMNSIEMLAIEQVIKQAFLFGYIWSFGGILAAGIKNSREEFDGLLRLMIENCNDQYTVFKNLAPESMPPLEIVAPFENFVTIMPRAVLIPLIPNQGSVFDYYIDWHPILDFQNQIYENFTFLPPSSVIGQDIDRFKAFKNDQVFSITSSQQIAANLTNISNLLTQLSDEQQQLIASEQIRPSSVTFNTFTDLIQPYAYKPRVPFFNIFIETSDTLRYKHLMETLLKSQLPVLLTGTAGSGKTSVVMNMLASLDQRQISQNIQINFSARTSSLRIQQIVEDSLFQKGKTYLPQPGKVGILYIDDMNLPAKDQYECSQPIEFLRFFMDTMGFYDRKELHWKNVENTTLLASCAPPGGGRETLTTRLTSSFTMIAQPESEDDSLCKIYNTILQSFFAFPEYKYSSEIVQSAPGIVKALVQIYHNLSNILKPTPSKLHYSFNLRDVSKVIQGLMRSSAKILKTSDELISIFIHETMRVFADRTISAFDNEQVCKCVTEVLNTCPGTGLKKSMVYESLYEDDGTMKTFEEAVPTNPAFYEAWGNYMKFGAPAEEKIYEQKDSKFVQNIMYQYLDQYNTESGKQKMNLVLFEDAVNYVSKITRILSSERGNLLNVGVGGSGRKSLTRLAAHMCDYKVESIQLKKGYGQSDFHADVKELYIRCGLKGENIVFLLDESQLVSGAILEDINNILNSGIISNLFDQKDMEKIITDTRAQINEQGLADMIDTNNKASVFNYFISKVRDKLHIVLCLSPSGEEFRARLRTYPSLLTCMSIVWFHPWPRSALQDVSKKILTEDLQKVDFESLVGADADAQAKFAKQLAIKLAPVATEIHSNTERLLINYAKETNRRHYLPPATFLDLLSIYSALLNTRIKEISTRLMQFKTGVQRLIDAKAQVETLQKQQQALKPELEKQTIITNELIQKINVETVQVNELRKKATEDAAIVAAQTKDCKMIADDADRDLKACEPIIQEATRAVDNIDSGMIAEMKQVKNPAPLVFLTMQSVAILLSYKPDWQGCVQMFSNASFLQSLKGYDRDNISDSVLKQLKKFTESKQYEISAIEKVSVACKSLAVWVLAIEKYAQVYREVEPKRKRLQQANEDLEQKQAALRVKQEHLAKVEAEFKLLTDKFNKSNNEKIELEKAMELTKARLDRAEKLTGALGDERVRWIKQSEELQELMTMVVGDVFLASCGIGYFGVFNREYRTKLITYWQGLLEIYGIKTSSIQQILQKGLFGLISSDEIVLERWKDCGLPNDMQSIDNALIMDQIMKSKWPLLIDPQNQASAFIKKLEKRIKVIRPTQFGIVHIFEAALHDGDCILLDGVGEKLDPTLSPIIEKQFVTLPNGQQQVNLGGDQPIDVHKDFKLYITTKLQNPRYSPETHAKLQIINFSISVDALEQQILSEVIQLEYPALEETRVELAKDASANKKQLLELADKILHHLSSFQGSVLDNEPLIQVLNESKRVSQIIKEKEIASASTRAEIAKYYSLYNPIGVRAALIYFLISDMSMVEPMYLFALGYYKQLVQQEIKRIDDFHGDQDKISQRVEIIIEKMTFNLFTSISRGLFEKDKTIFSFLLGCRVYQRMGLIKKEEWNLFVKGQVYADIFLSDPLNIEKQTEAQKVMVETVDKAQLSEKLSSQIKVMCNLEYMRSLEQICIHSLNELKDNIQSNKKNQLDMINYIITLDAKLEDKFPVLRDKVSTADTTIFQRLLLIKLIADEFFYMALPQFVESLLDKRYSAIKPQSIKQLYQDSTPFSPMLFIISEGVDPVAQTCQLAEELKQQVSIISLGKGQTPLVQKELAKATAEGRWLFLQNVHLAAADFLPELELIVETINLSSQQTTGTAPQSQLEYLNLPLHQNFRLLLSSTPVDTFPQSVLQASLKCTTEPPLSMKKNILRQLGMIEPAKFEFEALKSQIPSHLNSDGVQSTWKRIVYSLMYFHSQILERKKFGPQGYNLNYDFNDTDLEICILTLEDFFIKSFKSEHDIPSNHFIKLDWPALEFIFSAIHYSGKVNDSWDKRCVGTILRALVHNGVCKCNNPNDSRSNIAHDFVEGDSRYSLSYIQANTSIQDIIQEVQQMPNIDGTKVFGMSSNSDIVNQQSECSRIIARVLGVSSDCLIALQDQQVAEEIVEDTPKEVKDNKEKKGEKLTKEQIQAQFKQRISELNVKVFGIEVKTKSQDEIVKGITEQLLKKLPKLLNINDASQKSIAFDENNIPLCMTTILKQEMERFNLLLSFIKKSLQNIALAIKGDVILSQDLEEQYKSLYIGKVPAAWNKIAYPSLKPLASWFEDLILRVQFMQGWLQVGPPGSYWLSGLYFPQGFITAVLQTHARKYKISVDTLKFEFQFSSVEWESWEAKNFAFEKEPTSVWIHGLYCDCGFFDLQKGKLEQSKEGILYPKLPYIKMIPVESKPDKVDVGYTCPVYKTSQRAGVLSSTGQSTNFILPMIVPTDHTEDYFVRFGTCALCQLDD
ncbi:Dynein_heavy chain [Hexamita inflata]|uniref:Dynein heavy chain n=1 Tax=Hexamita inflata TaxID=28002 RepID=A0AA86QG64_9EUKA|nr:Dynein heavy chain [Hexamita inflata]